MAGGGSVMTRKVWPVRKKPSLGSLSGLRPDYSLGTWARHTSMSPKNSDQRVSDLSVCLTASDLAPHPLHELDLGQDQGSDFAGLRLGGRRCWPGCRAGPGGGHGCAAGPLELTGRAARGRESRSARSRFGSAGRCRCLRRQGPPGLGRFVVPVKEPDNSLAGDFEVAGAVVVDQVIIRLDLLLLEQVGVSGSTLRLMPTAFL